jgi:hypothetical protein
LEFLKRCHAIYLFTPNASQDAALLSPGMTEEFDVAQEYGLEVKFMAAEEPPLDFQPVWGNVKPGVSAQRQPSVENKLRRVFVCSKLRPLADEPEPEITIRHNIRLAQWLCYSLLTSPDDLGYTLVPFAPQAFYPYFIDYDPVRKEWLPSSEEVLQLCEAIYVFTEDGMGEGTSISPGMRVCIERANDLGLEIRHKKIAEPPANWEPQPWFPPSQKKMSEIGGWRGLTPDLPKSGVPRKQ